MDQTPTARERGMIHKRALKIKSQRYRWSSQIGICLLCPLLWLLPLSRPVMGENIAVVCPKAKEEIQNIARKAVYANTPFKALEKATYEISYMGMKAGYGTLSTKNPFKYKGVWHRVFHVDAHTGDWFKAIFVAKETMEALSRPWDFGVARFYISQNEGKLFSSPFVQKKWLEFDHQNCLVRERIQRAGKPESREEFPLHRGAIDALGAIFAIRSRHLKVGQKERAPIYTSQQNWWLEADPVALETVDVAAGTFKAFKIKLQTFIGHELQQKGDVFAWIADSKSKELVQIQGEIKIGSVWIKLHKYQSGKEPVEF
jgi:hypothetical protein